MTAPAPERLADLSDPAQRLLVFMAETPAPHLFTKVYSPDPDVGPQRSIELTRRVAGGGKDKCTGPWAAWEEIRSFIPGFEINEAGRALITGAHHAD